MRGRISAVRWFQIYSPVNWFQYCRSKGKFSSRIMPGSSCGGFPPTWLIFH